MTPNPVTEIGSSFVSILGKPSQYLGGSRRISLRRSPLDAYSTGCSTGRFCEVYWTKEGMDSQRARARTINLIH